MRTTILHQLGLDHTKLAYCRADRDYRLTDVHGEVVKEILGIDHTRRHLLSHHGGDPNGKPLLGSTMSLFGSGMSYGHSRSNANLPLVLAGGSDLGLKHGGHLDFNQGHIKGYQLDKPGEHYSLCSRPANSNAHMSNLLLLMAQRMGLETDKFGDSNKGITL
jgi:hypothetical protein